MMECMASQVRMMMNDEDGEIVNTPRTYGMSTESVRRAMLKDDR